MSDLSTIASLSTAGGTLVLAVATYSSVRASHRAARVAERTLMLGIRPVLIPGRADDPSQEVSFAEAHWVTLSGGEAAVERRGDDVFYFAFQLRNAGAGLAVLHSWYLTPGRPDINAGHADLDEFRRTLRDIYIPPGDIGFWQGAIREPDDPLRRGVGEAVDAHDMLTVDILYGDHEGGQRTVSRFVLMPGTDSSWVPAVVRHWNVDYPSAR